MTQIRIYFDNGKPHIKELHGILSNDVIIFLSSYIESEETKKNGEWTGYIVDTNEGVKLKDEVKGHFRTCVFETKSEKYLPLRQSIRLLLPENRKP